MHPFSWGRVPLPRGMTHSFGMPGKMAIQIHLTKSQLVDLKAILDLGPDVLGAVVDRIERLEPIPFKWAQVTASCYLGFAENRGNQEAATRMPRGQCTLPADEAGRILDRLTGLEQVIHPEAIRQSLIATGRVNTCDCVLTY